MVHSTQKTVHSKWYKFNSTKLLVYNKIKDRQVGPIPESNSILKCILVCGLEFNIQNLRYNVEISKQ